MTPTEIATGIKALLPNIASLPPEEITSEQHAHLAKAYALVQASECAKEDDDLRVAIQHLMDMEKTQSGRNKRETAIRTIETILHRVVAIIELTPPE